MIIQFANQAIINLLFTLTEKDDMNQNGTSPKSSPEKKNISERKELKPSERKESKPNGVVEVKSGKKGSKTCIIL